MELFTETRAKAEIVSFPLDRQAGYITEAVRQLDRRDDRLAQKWWNTECNRLYARLQVAGVPHDAIRAELARFAIAVQNRRRIQHGAQA